MRTLTDAGLLAPHLPEPDEEGRFIVGQRAIWVDSSGVLCIELRGLDGYVATDGVAIPIGEAAEAQHANLKIAFFHGEHVHVWTWEEVEEETRKLADQVKEADHD